MSTCDPKEPPDPEPGGGRSYLLRVRSTRDGERFVLQDLKTGERRAFESEAELRQFIAALRAAGLR